MPKHNSKQFKNFERLTYRYFAFWLKGYKDIVQVKSFTQHQTGYESTCLFLVKHLKMQTFMLPFHKNQIGVSKA
jgi:hypothetical protein